jgi:hypothetical protein
MGFIPVYPQDVHAARTQLGRHMSRSTTAWCLVPLAHLPSPIHAFASVIGRDLLLHGQGIVMCHPLVLSVLQLIHTTGGDEWGQFFHLARRFVDFAEISREIDQETFCVMGQNKGVSKLPIGLHTVAVPHGMDGSVVWVTYLSRSTFFPTI